MYIFKIPHSRKKTFEKLFQRKNFVHSFESKREKETQSSSQSMDLVCFFSVLQIILSWEADIHESQSITNCVRVEIYFKEIVSNTRLDLYHSFFTHLVCEFLIICKLLLIYIQYLFIIFVYHIYLCYCLYLDLYVIPFG